VQETLLPDERIVGDSRLSGKEVVWVDARSEEAYKDGHIPGAVLLNHDGWDTMLGNLFEAWKPDRTIVVYCSEGCQASREVANRIRNLGLEPVYVLKGGYDSWKQSHARSAAL